MSSTIHENTSEVTPFQVIVCCCFRLVLYAGLLLVWEGAHQN